MPSTLSHTRLSPRRAELASFSHALAVAIQLRAAGRAQQFVIETGNPLQPFRVTEADPGDPERLLARVA